MDRPRPRLILKPEIMRTDDKSVIAIHYWVQSAELQRQICDDHLSRVGRTWESEAAKAITSASAAQLQCKLSWLRAIMMLLEAWR